MWAAFKITSHRDPTDPDTTNIDCKYPGMKAHPFSGVSIRIWSLAKQDFTDEFEIYGAVNEKSACSTSKKSKAQLAAVKAKIAALGMNLEQKPVSTMGAFKEESEGHPIGTESRMRLKV